jgi:hypothetical protein
MANLSYAFNIYSYTHSKVTRELSKMANGMVRASLRWLAVVKSRESSFTTNCVANLKNERRNIGLILILILFYNMHLLKL